MASIPRGQSQVAMGRGRVDLATWDTVAATECGVICTVAPWQLWVADRDEGYRRVLERARLVIADGNGVLVALALRGLRQDRLTGRELVERVADGRLWPGTSVVVVGASDRARSVVAQCYGWAGCGGSYSRHTIRGRAETIDSHSPKGSAPSVVYLVALGSPVQELISAQLVELNPTCVAVGVGGAIETLAGTVSRPPTWVVRCKVEFLYRAAKQPHLRIRVLQALLTEIKLILEAVRLRVSPSAETRSGELWSGQGKRP